MSYLCDMIMLLLSFVFLADTLSHDTIRTDTLPQVTVRANQEMTIQDAIKNFIDRQKAEQGRQPKVPSLGDILQKHAPRLTDQITHPFAIKQRKKEKQRKRHQEILKHYDQVQTFDVLLREQLLELQQEDSLRKLQEGK